VVNQSIATNAGLMQDLFVENNFYIAEYMASLSGIIQKGDKSR